MAIKKGDEVLKNIGRIIRENIRKGDIVAQIWGEEFTILLPDTNEEKATEISNKIREAVERKTLWCRRIQSKGMLTISAGVSVVFPDKAKDEMQLLKSSDDALYRAKFLSKTKLKHINLYRFVKEI